VWMLFWGEEENKDRECKQKQKRNEKGKIEF
jgi:hypothetical protein